MAELTDFRPNGHLRSCGFNLPPDGPACYGDCAEQLLAVAERALGKMQPPALTDLQREIIHDAGKLWTKICQAIPDGVTRTGDLDELIKPIHLIQRYFMGEAAAVAYPAEFRGLGIGMRFVHRADRTPGTDATICQVSEYRGHAGRCEGDN